MSYPDKIVVNVAVPMLDAAKGGMGQDFHTLNMILGIPGRWRYKKNSEVTVAVTTKKTTSHVR